MTSDSMQLSLTTATAYNITIVNLESWEVVFKLSIKPHCHNYSFYNIIGLPSEKKDEKTGTLALGWHSKLYVHTCIHVHVYTCACTCSLYMHICTGNVLKLQIPTCMCAHVTNSPNANNRQCFPTIKSTLSTTVSLLFALASIGAVALGCA